MNKAVGPLRSALVTIRYELAEAERVVLDVLQSYRSGGFDREAPSLEEALADDLRALTETAAALFEQAHQTAGDDWEQQCSVLLERFDEALEPLREGFVELHNLAREGLDEAQDVLQDELNRIDAALDALGRIEEPRG